MKIIAISLLFALTFLSSARLHAQTFDQMNAAMQRGEHQIAFQGFTKLADRGDLPSQFLLGLMHEFGMGIPKSDSQAYIWYRKAAELGEPNAQSKVGLFMAKGRGVEKDDFQAVFWYRRAAEQGDTDAQASLGSRYADGRGVTKDTAKAYFWSLLASSRGYRDFLFGDTAATLADAEAQKLTTLQRADIQSEVSRWRPRMEAQSKMSTSENVGGTPIGDGAALSFQQAEAARARGDDQTAFKAFSALAELGNVSAQAQLGAMYEDGSGTAKDESKAVFWHQKAASQGDRLSQYLLGRLYFDGRGIAKNYSAALLLYRKSAEQGFSLAQLNLGVIYSKGEGAPKDVQQAYFWFLLAGAKGNKKAIDYRDQVERQLTIEQRVAAQTAARNWRQKTAEQANLLQNSDPITGGSASPSPSRSTETSTQANTTGSGFRIANGAVVTNHHVVDGCSRLRVNGVSAQVRGSDARIDLALLNATSPGPNAILRAQRAAVGEPVAVAGFPLRGLLSGFNMTTGNLSSMSGMGGDTRLVQITAPVQPGNSGGPVLDSAGNLMGVVVAKLDAIKAAKLTGDIPQNVNFAINANVLRSFLDANSVEYDTASSDKTLPPTVIADKAKSFTVLVECWK